MVNYLCDIEIENWKLISYINSYYLKEEEILQLKLISKILNDWISEYYNEIFKPNQE